MQVRCEQMQPYFFSVLCQRCWSCLGLSIHVSWTGHLPQKSKALTVSRADEKSNGLQNGYLGMCLSCGAERKALLANAFEDPSLCRSPGCLRSFELPLRRNCAEKILHRSTATYIHTRDLRHGTASCAFDHYGCP